MTILELLDRNKKRRSFRDTIEYKYYFQNRQNLIKLPKFNYLQKKDYDEFDIFRMNIILRAYSNKVILENEANNIGNYNVEEYMDIIKLKMVNEPYFFMGNQKIYIPFFSKVINLIYLEEPRKLLQFPYASLKDDFSDMVIDPFDTYGYELFNSYFTRLVKISEKDDTAAYFFYDMNTIYIVNNQGRLDAKIVLFDRYIRHPNYNHMLERLKPVVDAYFDFDKKRFLESLKKNGFLSTRMYYMAKLFEWRKSR